jgi:hypothetical protein
MSRCANVFAAQKVDTPMLVYLREEFKEAGVEYVNELMEMMDGLCRKLREHRETQGGAPEGPPQ